MHRRGFLAAAASAPLLVGTGCLGGRSGPPGPRDGDELPADGDPADGYPPAFGTTPEPPSVDPASFPRVDVDGVSVPLAPIEAVYRWYARGEARFVDARGPGQYVASHIYGAVHSPAPDGSGAGDPVQGWPTDARIVCYCGCPHHLSSLRAASLLAAGFVDVAVIDEGFWEWHDRGYPLAGSETERTPPAREIRGRVDPGLARGTAWVRHGPSGQVEAARIGPDGRYRLEVRFAGVTPGTVLVVETPAYRVTAPLRELTDGDVTG